ncbi:MAG: hypothetical protein WC551_08735 [Patescibacteria group bacterium]
MTFKQQCNDMFAAIEAELSTEMRGNPAPYPTFRVCGGVGVSITNVSRTAEPRLSCVLSAPSCREQEFVQRRVKSRLDPTAIAEAIVEMSKKSEYFTKAKRELLAQAKAAVVLAAPDAPVQQYGDGLSFSIFGERYNATIEIDQDSGTVDLVVRCVAHGFSPMAHVRRDDYETFSAEAFQQYIAELWQNAAAEHVMAFHAQESEKLSRELAEQLNDCFPLISATCGPDADHVEVTVRQPMIREQVEQLNAFLATLQEPA